MSENLCDNSDAAMSDDESCIDSADEQDIIDIPEAALESSKLMSKRDNLLPSEKVHLEIENVRVRLFGDSDIRLCNLVATNYQLLCISPSDNKMVLVSITMGCIHRVKRAHGSELNSKKSDKKKKDKKKRSEKSEEITEHDSTSKYTLQIECKDLRTLEILFSKKDDQRAAKLIISKYAFPSSVSSLFAFSYGKALKNADEINGLCMPFDLNTEYKRQGIDDQGDFVRISDVNVDFKLCSTYPKYIVVPWCMSDEELQTLSSFRSRSRIQAIVWKHPLHQAHISRCSQPNVGLMYARCPEDERMVSALRLNEQPKMYIMDSRPRANAVANMLKGGGYEGNSYKDCTLEFQNIGNIHVMRNSLKQLTKICQSPPTNIAQFQAEVDATKWLDHVRLVIVSAVRVAELIEKDKASVLVHCSDGWDRTSQTVALAELFLDPYYRTIEGFLILIEKEWLQFGHQFALRHGHGNSMENYKESQRSPIFLQFMDAVWQLLKWYPKEFEFNEVLLLELLDALFSCKFGNFLFDCVQAREKGNVFGNTACLWHFIKSSKAKYINKEYRCIDGIDVEQTNCIIPDISELPLQLWCGLHLRWKSSKMKKIAVRERLVKNGKKEISEVKLSASSAPVLDQEPRTRGRANTSAPPAMEKPKGKFSTISFRKKHKVRKGITDMSSQSSNSSGSNEVIENNNNKKEMEEDTKENSKNEKKEEESEEEKEVTTATTSANNKKLRKSKNEDKKKKKKKSRTSERVKKKKARKSATTTNDTTEKDADKSDNNDDKKDVDKAATNNNSNSNDDGDDAKKEETNNIADKTDNEDANKQKEKKEKKKKKDNNSKEKEEEEKEKEEKEEDDNKNEKQNHNEKEETSKTEVNVDSTTTSTNTNNETSTTEKEEGKQSRNGSDNNDNNDSNDSDNNNDDDINSDNEKSS